MSALIGTGLYRQSEWFSKIWEANTDTRNQGLSRYHVVKLQVDADWGDFNKHGFGDIVKLSGNLGHVGDLLNSTKKYDFCGWSSSVMALAMIAYAGEADLIYKEQDCLAFGPWIDQMYADMGDGDMVFGRKMTSAPWMECAQSLFLIRHSFIPHFVWQYLGQGKDGDLSNLPETKFSKIEGMNEPGRIRRLSFGYDRERPINFDDKVWYGQKFTPQEFEELKRRKMI